MIRLPSVNNRRRSLIAILFVRSEESKNKNLIKTYVCQEVERKGLRALQRALVFFSVAEDTGLIKTKMRE